MLSECAWGVSCVGEVKPSRWVYIMNLIGILASKWKYLWYLHLEHTLCTHLKSIKDWNCCNYKYLEPWNSFIVMFTDALMIFFLQYSTFLVHFSLLWVVSQTVGDSSPWADKRQTQNTLSQHSQGTLEQGIKVPKLLMSWPCDELVTHTYCPLPAYSWDSTSTLPGAPLKWRKQSRNKKMKHKSSLSFLIFL